MRRYWLITLIGVALTMMVAAVVLAIRGYQERWDPPDPAAVVRRAVVGTLQSPAFRFESTFLIQVDGREEVVSRFSGERASGDRFHYKGIMLQSPAEFYTAGSVFYLWDPVKKTWYTLEKNSFGPQDLLLSEVSPLSIFDFQELQNVGVLGRERVRDRECLLLDYQTEVHNRLLNVLWKDFHYRLWIDPWKNVICKTVVEATSRNAPNDRLLLTVEFFDYDGTHAVEPPVLP
ncbi:hypothetical protein [Heliophilum fasciatum]|uniref:Outer membrane lipoprotein-sorting protein n=1 Tax=Heliophilum fasciatum TaxID=35700 RepID=A0A4R2RG83_9FIRM|nr:hypothetical protein [Heliophilum fasciatum]MCW2278628.1 hypothetical protein [Heliophilum fasciatum]TCP62670.1 hypothetical protein EDD73_11918 [Heliophilum fasciatum]